MVVRSGSVYGTIQGERMAQPDVTRARMFLRQYDEFMSRAEPKRGRSKAFIQENRRAASLALRRANQASPGARLLGEKTKWTNTQELGADEAGARYRRGSPGGAVQAALRDMRNRADATGQPIMAYPVFSASNPDHPILTPGPYNVRGMSDRDLKQMVQTAKNQATEYDAGAMLVAIRYTAL